MTQIERRVISNHASPVTVESREDGTKTLVGYGAVFYRNGVPGCEYQLWDDVYERIAPTAFDRALREQHDARGLFNHDPNHLLGRVGSRTMRLSVDHVGLRYEIDLDLDNPSHVSILRSIERGDLSGSSFSFRATKISWQEESDREIRNIEDLDLYDTGPVTFPAYEGTTVSARSEQAVESARDEYQEWKTMNSPDQRSDEVIATPETPETDHVEAPEVDGETDRTHANEEMAYRHRLLIAAQF